MSKGRCKLGSSLGWGPRRLHDGAGLAHLAFRQREIECRTVALFAFQPDPPAVPFPHALDDRQPDPRSVFVALQSLEDLENLLEIFLLDAQSIVAHEKLIFNLIRSRVRRFAAAHVDD